MNNVPDERLVPLPILVRPRSGETTGSYIRRLARDNHLKPSYLHGFLAGPPTWFGKPRLERLAVLSGRTPQVLRKTLSDAGPAPGRDKPGPSNKPQRIDKAELYRRIRHDAETENLSMRALVRRHHVTGRTVKAALTNPEPPARKSLPRRPSAIDPIQHLIDSMIENGHRPTEIWTRLMDEHDVSISYGLIRLYVHNQTMR